MTARAGSMSVDGTPISQTDLARIEAEDQLHQKQQRSAARVVAACALDLDDARMLLSILGLGDDVVRAARNELGSASPTAKRSRKRHAA